MSEKRATISESGEDYLETILVLEQNGKVRCVDVARILNVSKPSVNKAMNVLKEKGYILQEVYGDIQLTLEGRRVAEQVYERHRTICAFFHEVLGVSLENAEEDACKVEHVISDETFSKMKIAYESERKGQ